MSLFLILLAAGESKRLKSSTPKPYQIINNKSLIEYSINVFKEFNEKPNHLTLLSYDLVGLIYYLSIKNDMSTIDKLF